MMAPCSLITVAILLLGSACFAYGVDITILDKNGHVSSNTALSSVWCPAHVVLYPGMWTGLLGSYTQHQCAHICIKRAYSAILHSRTYCACAPTVNSAHCGHSKTATSIIQLMTLSSDLMTSVITTGGAIAVKGIGAGYSCPSGSTTSVTFPASGTLLHSCSARCFSVAQYSINNLGACKCADMTSLPGQCSKSVGLSTSGVSSVDDHVAIPRVSARVLLRLVRAGVVTSVPSHGGRISGVTVRQSTSSGTRITWSPVRLPYHRRADQYSVYTGSGTVPRTWYRLVNTGRHDISVVPTTRSALISQARVNYHAHMNELPGVDKTKVRFLNGGSKYGQTYKVVGVGTRTSASAISATWPVVSQLPKPSARDSLYFTAIYLYKFSIRPRGGAAGAFTRVAAKSFVTPQQSYQISTAELGNHQSVDVQVDINYRKLWKMFEVPAARLIISSDNGALRVSWPSLPGQPKLPRYRYLIYTWPKDQSANIVPKLTVKEVQQPLQQVVITGIDPSVKYRARVVIMFISSPGQAFLVDPGSVRVTATSLQWGTPAGLPTGAKRYRVRILVSVLDKQGPGRVLVDDRVTDSRPSNVPLPALLSQYTARPHRILVYIQTMLEPQVDKSLPMQALINMPRIELSVSSVRVILRPGEPVLVQFRPITDPGAFAYPAYYLIRYTPLVGSPADVTMWTPKLLALTSPLPSNVNVLLPATDGSNPYLVKVYHVPTHPTGLLATSSLPVPGKAGSYRVTWSPVTTPGVTAYALFIWSVDDASPQPRFTRVVPAAGQTGAEITTVVDVVDVNSPVFLVSPLPTPHVIAGVQFVAGLPVKGAPNQRYVRWRVTDPTVLSYAVYSVPQYRRQGTSGTTGQPGYRRQVTLTGRVTLGQQVNTHVILPAEVTADQHQLFIVQPLLRLPRVSGTRLVDSVSVAGRSHVRRVTWHVSPEDAADVNSYAVFAASSEGSWQLVHTVHSPHISASSVTTDVQLPRQLQLPSGGEKLLVYPVRAQPLSAGVVFITDPTGGSSSTERRVHFRVRDPAVVTYAIYTVTDDGVQFSRLFTVAAGKEGATVTVPVQKLQQNVRYTFLIHPLSADCGITPGQVTGSRVKVTWTVQDLAVRRYSVYSVSATGTVQYLTMWSTSGAAIPVRGTVISALVSAPSDSTTSYLVVPVPHSTLFTGAELVSPAQQSGTSGTHQLQWLVRDQTVKRYLVYSMYPGRRVPQFVLHQSAGKNPSTGDKVVGKVPVPTQNLPRVYLVYPVPNQRFINTDGASAVLGSVYKGSVYAVRWLVHRGDVSVYAMFAVLPGRVPLFRRTVYLGEDIDVGGTRTDYVGGLMPGVQYTFLVVPVTDSVSVTSESVGSDSVRVSWSVGSRPIADHYSIFRVGTSAADLVRVVPGGTSVPRTADSMYTRTGSIISVEVPKARNKIVVLPIYTNLLLKDWPAVDTSITSTLDPLPIVGQHLNAVATIIPETTTSIASSDHTRVSWTVPESLQRFNMSRIVYVNVYRLLEVAEGGRRIMVVRAVPTTNSVEVLKPSGSGKARYVVVYYGLQSGTESAQVSAVPGSSSAVRVTWPVHDSRILLYSVYAAGTTDTPRLVRVVPGTAVPSISLDVEKQLIYPSLGDKYTAVIVQADRPQTPIPDAKFTDGSPVRISWTVDTEHVAVYAIFLLYADRSQPALAKIVPAGAKVKYGRTLTADLDDLRVGVKYQYLIVPVLAQPSTAGSSVPGQSTSRKVTWLTPDTKVEHYAIFTLQKLTGGTDIRYSSMYTVQDASAVPYSHVLRTTDTDIEYLVIGLPHTLPDPAVSVTYPQAGRSVPSIGSPSDITKGSLVTTDHHVRPITLEGPSIAKKQYFQISPARQPTINAAQSVTNVVPRTHMAVSTVTLDNVRVTRLDSQRINLAWTLDILTREKIGYISVYELRASGERHLLNVISSDVTHYIVKHQQTSTEVQYLVHVVLVPSDVLLVTADLVAGHSNQRRIRWTIVNPTVQRYEIYLVVPGHRPKWIHSQMALQRLSARGQLTYTFTLTQTDIQTTVRCLVLPVARTSSGSASADSTVVRFRIDDVTMRDYGIFYTRPGIRSPVFSAVKHLDAALHTGDETSVTLSDLPAGVDYTFYRAQIPTAPNALVVKNAGGVVRLYYVLTGGWSTYALFIRDLKRPSVLKYISLLDAGVNPTYGERVGFNIASLTRSTSQYQFYVAPLLRPQGHNVKYKLRLTIGDVSVQNYAVLVLPSGGEMLYGGLVAAGSNPRRGSVLTAVVDGLVKGTSYHFFCTALPSVANVEVSTAAGVWSLRYRVVQSGVLRYALFAGTQDVQFIRMMNVNGAPVGARIETSVDSLPTDVAYKFYIVPVYPSALLTRITSVHDEMQLRARLSYSEPV